MNLSEISQAFKECTGDVSRSFKDYIISLELTKEEFENGYITSEANDYILRDVEILLSKSLINLCAADLLLKKGYFNWGFVTSYYSNFFSIQLLNRLKLNFNTWTHSGLECRNTGNSYQELEIIYANSSSGSHDSQFNRFIQNYSNFTNSTSIDRYWSLGIRSFRMRPEATLRNEINYHIEESYYYELNLDLIDFNKIIADNKKDPSRNRVTITRPVNYALPNLELAISRIRVSLYILNYMANANSEYKPYFIRRNKSRLDNLLIKYPNLSSWIKDLLVQWLLFIEIETDDVLT